MDRNKHSATSRNYLENSSNSSLSDSFSDGSESTNWEEHVAADGSLFYAEYLPYFKSKYVHEKKIDFTGSNLRLGKMLTRRQQQQKSKSKNFKSNLYSSANAADKEVNIKFSSIDTLGSPDSLKELEMVITSSDRFRFGRRSTAIESILGFRVVPFVDQPECIMFDGFVHEVPTSQQVASSIKRGDWFKSLDDIEIRTSNVDELLLQFTKPTKISLKFQGIIENKDDNNETNKINPVRKIETFKIFAHNFQNLYPLNLKNDISTPMPFGMFILPPECYQHDQHKNFLYCYPQPANSNFLYRARGSFLTLNAVLSEELKTNPLVSKLRVDDLQYFVSYKSLNGFLVLVAYVSEYITLSEANLRSEELMDYLRFTYPTLSMDKFSNGNQNLNNLIKFLDQICEIQKIRLVNCQKQRICFFDELLKESRSLPLPKEAQLRIFDALSEMEAMDYRNWNDEPLNTHREFFIHGSVLYYDNYILASQMPIVVRSHVENFLRCRGIFDFFSNQNVRELYIWQEIYLPNSIGRFFLTVCSRSRLLLAVILKTFDAPDLSPDAIIPPSLFYIEEIQETLEHLILCGIESLAMFWSVSNKRPEILNKLEVFEESNSWKETNRLDIFSRQKLTTPSSSGSARSISHDEDTHLGSSLGGSSINSLSLSEEESTRKRVSNNPRHANMNSNADDTDSGSDWENFAEQHSFHYRLNVDNQSIVTESLWKEISNIVPVKISAGWKNSVFYYISVDNANGSIYCPLKSNSETFPFLKEMKKTCHVIHDVLQNTKTIRRTLGIKASKVTNFDINSSGTFSCKSMLAIKEYGVTIQVRDSNSDSRGDLTNSMKGRFIVVGRLFHSPSKEVYLCYRPDVPQNMVEMAFRLSFFSVG